jgi:hypothetical protein
MKPHELVDHIRSGPAKLRLLYDTPRFRRRTRSNPCDFNEFLRALQSSQTIRTVACWSHTDLGITEDEWVLLIKTIAIIADIHTLKLTCETGSGDFHPFQAVADAVKSAQSLCKLEVVHHKSSLPRDPSGLTALANALRERRALQEFTWFDWCYYTRHHGGTIPSILYFGHCQFVPTSGKLLSRPATLVPTS